VAWDRGTMWRQGHLLSDDAIDALKINHRDGDERPIVIVATHDCDLAQDPEQEPNVEVVVGRFVGCRDGNCTHAKNARRLHIEFVGNIPFWGEFEATDKLSIDKISLNKFTPQCNAYLTSEGQATFQIWLASRYRRSAFPDEFERRLTRETKLADKISRMIKPYGEIITGVFFDVDSGEEVTRSGPDDTYVLDITILYTSPPDSSEASEGMAFKLAQAIEKVFKEKLFDPANKWQHIELRFCDAISESALTYDIFRQLKRWRLDHISLGADPQQPGIAE